MPSEDDILYTLRLDIAPDKLERLTELLGHELLIELEHAFRDAADRLNRHADYLEENEDERICFGEYQLDIVLKVREGE